MKYFSLLFIGLLLVSSGSAAATEEILPNNQVQRHDGFYFSFALGPAWNKIQREVESITYQGYGALLDLKMGGAWRENWLLFAEIIWSKNMTTEEASKFDDMTVEMELFGIGLTHYFMPANFFLSGTVGFSRLNFSQIDFLEPTYSSKLGLGLAAKAGKEWWIADNLGLGVSLLVMMEKNEGKDYVRGISETLRGDGLALLFNFTYN
jgi:hypothetical protein